MTGELRRLAAGDPSLTPSGDLSDARAAVAAASPGDDRHEAARQQMLAFIDDHPDALHRSCTEGHLTGSAAVIDPASGAVLLLLHAKVGRWLQPGGHADGDANLAAVALREAAEETGIAGLQVVTPAIDLDIHLFHDRTGADEDHLHLDVRHLVLAPPGAEVHTNDESRAHRWCTPEALHTLAPDPGLLRLIRSARAVLPRVT
jgi:8-oxo-dGTP pyrophosphatase MutT (NUDIX family)